jgi:hypothetical protein
VNAPQAFAVDGNRLLPVTEVALCPCLHRRLEGCYVHLAEDLMQRRNSRRRGAREAEGRYNRSILFPTPLPDGIETAGTGEHRGRGQRQDRRQGMPASTPLARIGYRREGRQETSSDICFVHAPGLP